MRKLFLVAILFVTAGSVSGYNYTEVQQFEQQLADNSSELRQSLSDMDDIPGFVRNIVGGETVNLHIQTEEGESVIGVKMDGMNVQDVKSGGYENNTMKVEANSSALEAVADSDKPFEELEERLDSKDIRYSSTTTGGTIKLTIFDTVRKIVSALGISF